MTTYLNPLFLFVAFIFTEVVYAVDVPEDDLGAQAFNQARCFNQNKQTCMDSICLTSEDIDCEANCETMAKEKCQQQYNE